MNGQAKAALLVFKVPNHPPVATSGRPDALKSARFVTPDNTDSPVTP